MASRLRILIRGEVCDAFILQCLSFCFTLTWVIESSIGKTRVVIWPFCDGNSDKTEELGKTSADGGRNINAEHENEDILGDPRKEEWGWDIG